jgi:hypothetical protein
MKSMKPMRMKPAPWQPDDASQEQGDNMAQLTTKARKAIPTSKFGLPGSRKYPVQDKAHARNALSRASQMVNAGKLSPASAAKIRRKANAMLGK